MAFLLDVSVLEAVFFCFRALVMIWMVVCRGEDEKNGPIFKGRGSPNPSRDSVSAHAPFCSFFSFFLLLFLPSPAQPQQSNFHSRLLSNMNVIPTEVLSNCFERLNSQELVSITRVSKDWSEIINESKYHWQKLTLPEKQGGWDLKSLQLFDRKSESKLQQVSMNPKFNSETEWKAFGELLKKSKETLLVLYLKVEDPQAKFYLEELSFQLPLLVDCRISGWGDRGDRVRIIGSLENKIKKGSSKPRNSRDLRILWVPIGFSHLKQSDLLVNLVSLKLEIIRDYSQLRKCLQKCSQGLKHLDFSIPFVFGSPQYEPQELPRLQVLEIGCTPTLRYPSWLRIPSSATLIITGDLPPSLPSVSRLWLRFNEGFQNLPTISAELEEFRFEDNYLGFPGRIEALSSALTQRKSNASAGMEIEGIKMTPLKTLLIDCEGLSQLQLEEMKKVAENVVDVKRASTFIGVEI